jgi:hypothetical protein
MTASFVFKGTQKKRHRRKQYDFQTPKTQQPPLETEAVLVESETNGADRREILTEGGAEGRHRSSHHRCKTLHLGGRRVWIKGVRRREVKKDRLFVGVVRRD